MKLEKRQIARQFSRYAETYDACATIQRQMAMELIELLPSPPEGLLVDLGCGTGFALNEIFKRTQFELIGIDLAPGMIARAQREVPEAQFLISDLESTPLVDQTADVVLSNAAIQWCDTAKAFQEIFRILKPDGLVLISTFGPHTLNQWKTAWESIGEIRSRVHHFASPPQLRDLLQDKHFELIEMETEIRTREFTSVSKMFQSVKEMGATNATQDRPSGLLGKSRFRELCHYFESELQTAGVLRLDFECIRIVAKPTIAMPT